MPQQCCQRRCNLPIVIRFVWSCLVYKSYFLSQRIVFFSHIKSANGTFKPDLSAKQAQTDRTSGVYARAANVVPQQWGGADSRGRCIADVRAGWPHSRRARLPAGPSGAHGHAHAGGALPYPEEGDSDTAAEGVAQAVAALSSLVTSDRES